MKLSTKLIIGLASLLLLYGVVKQFQSPVSIQESVQSPEKKTSQDVSSVETRSNAAVVAATPVYDCAEASLPTSLNNQEFESWIKGKSHTREWHWDNYHAQNEQGDKVIYHVVKEQDQNGNEVLLLKTFKDEDEGPVLLDEVRFYQREKLNSALDKKLRSGTIEISQTIDSFQFPDGTEIKRTVENGEIQELRLASQKGILDCQKTEGITSCRCK